MNVENEPEYIGERLFDLRNVNRADIPENYTFTGADPVCRFRRSDKDDYTFTFAFAEWLSSPDGIHAVKQAMIERGYGWEGEYDHEFYSYAFYKEDHYHDSITICEPIETDAILKSVYVALKAEEDKANG